MIFQYSTLGLLLIISSVIVLSLSLISYQKRSSQMHIYFSLLMLAAFFWCFGSAMEFFSIEPWLKIFWIKISYLGVATAPVLWFFFILSYGQYDKYLKPVYMALIMFIPLFIMLMAFTNEWHGWLWPSITPVNNLVGSLLIYAHGPLFWINIIYSFIMILLGLILLFILSYDSPRVYRPQILILILSGIAPLLFSFLYISKIISIPGLDITPFGVMISGILVALGIFWFGFLNILPIAYKNLFENMKSMVMVFDKDNNLIEVNQAAELVGVTRKSLGKPISEVLVNFPEIISSYQSTYQEFELFLDDPFNYWVNVEINPLWEEDVLLGGLIIIQNIDKRKKLDENLKKSLEEKDLMMKEIHHRVKNNLMVIQSLLNLQSRYIKDKDVRGVFKESQNRAKSMALIHNQLYQSGDLTSIEFGSYIKNLSQDLLYSYLEDPEQIEMTIEVEEVVLDVDTAIPLAMILNELVSNSLKHAFPEGRKGHICVKFSSEDDVYKLMVKDDGIGIKDDFDFEKSDSLGLKLVQAFSDQIDAQIKLDTTQGTQFEIILQDKNIS